MLIKSLLFTKAFATNVALILFDFFMKMLNVLPEITVLESRKFTHITFVFLLVLMKSLNMSFKISFTAKTLVANVALMLPQVFMNNLNVFSQFSV